MNNKKNKKTKQKKKKFNWIKISRYLTYAWNYEYLVLAKNIDKNLSSKYGQKHQDQ